MPTLSDSIAAAIRAERARRRWTQAELGERAGIPRSTIGDLESGARQIAVNHLPALCRALHVSVVVLLQGADPEAMAALRLRRRDLLDD
jgi:transcriptional regulator with XRE-family HTH domain